MHYDVAFVEFISSCGWRYDNKQESWKKNEHDVMTKDSLVSMLNNHPWAARQIKSALIEGAVGFRFNLEEIGVSNVRLRLDIVFPDQPTT